MTLTKKDVGLIMVLCGLLILITGFFYGYGTFKEKKEEYITESNSLRIRNDALLEYQNNLSKYINKTTENLKTSDDFLNAFPRDVSGQTIIRDFAEYERTIKFKANSLVFTVPTEVFNFNGNSVQSLIFSVAIETDYKELKKLLDILTKNNKFIIDNMGISYNATNNNYSVSLSLISVYIK